MAPHRSMSVRPRRKKNNLKDKASDAEIQPTITFTGNRHNDHYEVIVRGEIVELPLACLKALISLVLARAESRQGFVHLNSVTVCRLRRAIDDAVGAGAGRLLIETGSSDEYRLTVGADELGSGVAFTPCFSDLVQLHVLSREVAAELASVSNEIDWKS